MNEIKLHVSLHLSLYILEKINLVGRFKFAFSYNFVIEIVRESKC
jgi:hypothetical protein